MCGIIDVVAADIISDPETSGAEINGNGSHSPEGAVETQEELQRKLEVANEEINKYLGQQPHIFINRNLLSHSTQAVAHSLLSY